MVAMVSRKIDSNHRRSGQGGQATVELLGLLPLVATLALALFTLLSSAGAAESASHAAHAGAVALLQDDDPLQAARKTLPTKWRKEAEVSVARRQVTVRVFPRGPIPLLRKKLAASSSADAGGKPVLGGRYE